MKAGATKRTVRRTAELSGPAGDIVVTSLDLQVLCQCLNCLGSEGFNSYTNHNPPQLIIVLCDCGQVNPSCASCHKNCCHQMHSVGFKTRQNRLLTVLCPAPRWESFQRSTRPYSWWGEASCFIPKTLPCCSLLYFKLRPFEPCCMS